MIDAESETSRILFSKLRRLVVVMMVVSIERHRW